MRVIQLKLLDFNPEPLNPENLAPTFVGARLFSDLDQIKGC
jgi:hypothetical protein